MFYPKIDIQPVTVHEGKKPVKCKKCEKCDSNISNNIKNVHFNKAKLNDLEEMICSIISQINYTFNYDKVKK